jgi:hypothetical protein
MSKLVDLIRAQRLRRAGTDDGPIVIIRSFIDPKTKKEGPWPRLASYGRVRFEQAPSKSHEVFEARVHAVANSH